MSHPVDIELMTFDPRHIVVVEKRNTRFDYGNLDELAESIRINGMKEPAKVQRKGDEFQLVNGHRRHRACMMLVEKGFVPDFMATVIPESDTESDILADMVIANDGKPFLPLEEAIMLQRLIEEYQWTQKQVADKIGRSLSHVSNRIALLNADDSVKEAMQNGEIKTQEALAIVRKSNGDKDMQKEIISRTRDGETGVINKELLQGRFNKEQWGVIKAIFLSLEIYEIDLTDLENKYARNENPEVMKAFVAGCFQACADMAFTEFEEFYNKVKAKIESEQAKAPIPAAPVASKSAIVETPKEEPTKKKPTKKVKETTDD